MAATTSPASAPVKAPSTISPSSPARTRARSHCGIATARRRGLWVSVLTGPDIGDHGRLRPCYTIGGTSYTLAEFHVFRHGHRGGARTVGPMSGNGKTEKPEDAAK